MSLHLPILPEKAIQATEAAGLHNAKAVLADFAAAGLIKTYALTRETGAVGGSVETVRDAQVPAGMWKRIVAENKVSHAMNGGTIRLEGSHLQGGAASVQITGISFSETSLAKVLERYCRTSNRSPSSGPTPSPSLSPVKGSAPVADVRKAKKVAPQIKPGDIFASIAQTEQVLGLGRTKVNDMIKQGILDIKKVGRRTLVTVESIERFSGEKPAP
ncbi:MAG: helix-turn-helix domain-containing protein [Allopontixanthobacter sediminis]